MDYAAKDTAVRPYQYTVLTPHVTVDRVTAESPIESGGVSNIHIQYDLLGAPAGQSFPMTLKVVEKGPDVADNASADYNLPSGKNVDLPLYFQTGSGSQGTYRFVFQLKVPIDSWKIPQITSKGSCTVVVKPPELSAKPSGAETSRGGALEVAR